MVQSLRSSAIASGHYGQTLCGLRRRSAFRGAGDRGVPHPFGQASVPPQSHHLPAEDVQGQPTRVSGCTGQSCAGNRWEGSQDGAPRLASMTLATLRLRPFHRSDAPLVMSLPPGQLQRLMMSGEDRDAEFATFASSRVVPAGHWLTGKALRGFLSVLECVRFIGSFWMVLFPHWGSCPQNTSACELVLAKTCPEV